MIICICAKIWRKILTKFGPHLWNLHTNSGRGRLSSAGGVQGGRRSTGHCSGGRFQTFVDTDAACLTEEWRESNICPNYFLSQCSTIAMWRILNFLSRKVCKRPITLYTKPRATQCSSRRALLSLLSWSARSRSVMCGSRQEGGF